MKSKIIKTYWIIFFFNPLLSLVLFLKRFNLSYAKNLIWAFTVFYGLTFAIGNESAGSDINRYYSELVNLNKISLDLNSAFNYFIYSGEADIVRTILSVTLSRFTSNLNILTLIYAFIFGFFYSRNISYLYENIGFTRKRFIILLFITIAFIIPIWNINGFRYYCASHVFLYGLLPYIIAKDKSKIIFIFLSPLFHFSFLAPVIIYLVYKLLGNRLNFYFIFFLLSSFLLEIDIYQVNTFLSNYLPSFLWERTDNYFNAENVLNYQHKDIFGHKVWYAVLYTKVVHWFIILSIILIFIRARKIITENNQLKTLFSFSLLFGSIANLMANVPSGGRFLAIATILFLVSLIIFSARYAGIKKIKELVIAYNFVFILFFIVTIRTAFYSFSLTTVLGNPIIALFTTENNISLNDVIK